MAVSHSLQCNAELNTCMHHAQLMFGHDANHIANPQSMPAQLLSHKQIGIAELHMPKKSVSADPQRRWRDIHHILGEVLAGCVRGVLLGWHEPHPS